MLWYLCGYPWNPQKIVAAGITDSSELIKCWMWGEESFLVLYSIALRTLSLQASGFELWIGRVSRSTCPA